jgi:tetratricopeptide (TPR) repeat protein
MQPENRTDFFISFNRADRAWAEWIAWQLEEAGYTTVFQTWDFRPGGNFVLDMQRAAAGAERTIAVLSPDYLTAEYPQPEWAAAFAQDPTGKQRQLVPVLVRHCEPRGLLAPLTHINLDGLSEDEATAELLAGVSKGRAKPASKPAFPAAPPRSAPQRPRFPGALPGVWNVPHNRNPHFTGRQDFLDALDRALTSGQPAALTQAIHGLGGVGKTQLATEYAYRNSHRYEVVWWVRSEETATLAADYAALAAHLGLPEASQTNQSITVEAVKLWFGRHAGWLLIFDNANRRGDVRPYLPQGATGHVIITSRDRDWKGLAAPLEVKTMPRPESVEFLLKRTDETDAGSADALAEQLGDLPLALEQAAAYVDATDETLATYLELFRAHHSRLLARGKPSTDYPDTVATTWDISFAEVRKQSDASEPLINLCAFLAPDDIPLDIIRAGSQFFPGPLASAVADPISLDDALLPLLRYSLLERRAQSLYIHRLVQTVVRDHLSEDERETWAAATVRMILEAFPFTATDVRTWPSSARLLQHALTAIEYVQGVSGLGSVVILLTRVGNYLMINAEFSKAKAAFERALQITELLLGPDHAGVALCLNELGNALHELGDFGGALASFERAIAIDEKVHGPKHPAVAIRLNNLGAVLKSQGDLAKAMVNYEKALAIHEAAYGLDHPSVATCLSNMGEVLWMQGDAEGARVKFERSLAMAEATYGPSHPTVARRLNNLGTVLLGLGDADGARTNFARALQIFRGVLDDQHPYVLDLQGKLERLEERGR